MQKRKIKNRFNKRSNFVAFLSIIVFILIVSYGFIFVDKQIKPTVLAIAEIKAKEIASKAINESIHSKITDDIRYQDLYFIRTDGDGNITFMQANTSITKLLNLIIVATKK